MIKFSSIESIAYSTIIFDGVLFILFPSFLYLFFSLPAAASIFTFLIFCHIIIFICRYTLKHEILWPIWADLLAILCGFMLLITALSSYSLIWILTGQEHCSIPPLPVYTTVLLFLSGTVLCYGHIRKIILPKLPYYFSPCNS